MHTLNCLINQRHKVYVEDLPLYRGIPSGLVNLDDYVVGSKGFWPAFTSTSKIFSIAEGFADKDCPGVVF
jgi:hypothetical protein